MRDRLLLVLIVATAMVISTVAVKADVPTLISYQGVLLDSDGHPVITPANVTFTLYDTPSDGIVIWQETQLVEFDEDGCFNVILGETTPVTDDVFDDPVRWLGVQVEGDDELIPRNRIVSVAYANRISTIDGATGGTISGDVAIQSDLDVDGDIRVTGKATIGLNHTNTGFASFVAGDINTVTGDYSTVAGGWNNTASGDESFIGGGRNNTAEGLRSAICGGYSNKAYGEDNAIGGGWKNITYEYHSAIGGGMEDTASASYSTVAGGYKNAATAWGSAIGGGQLNKARGMHSTVPGGFGNQALGTFSLAAGFNSIANHSGSFVWSDQTGSFSSTADNQFLIKASGNVGIGTDNPTSALHVEGEVKSVVDGVNFYMVPQGAIIMWSGSISSIPDGWALCNGAGDTPNLSDRFIYGTTGTPGGTGGSPTIPAHNHTVDIGTFNSGTTGFTWMGANPGFSRIADYRHTHSVNPPATGTTTNGGASNIPPYYSLAFIMKL